MEMEYENNTTDLRNLLHLPSCGEKRDADAMQEILQGPSLPPSFMRLCEDQWKEKKRSLPRNGEEGICVKDWPTFSFKAVSPFVHPDSVYNHHPAFYQPGGIDIFVIDVELFFPHFMKDRHISCPRCHRPTFTKDGWVHGFKVCTTFSGKFELYKARQYRCIKCPSRQDKSCTSFSALDPVVCAQYPDMVKHAIPVLAVRRRLIDSTTIAFAQNVKFHGIRFREFMHAHKLLIAKQHENAIKVAAQAGIVSGASTWPAQIFTREIGKELSKIINVQSNSA